MGVEVVLGVGVGVGVGFKGLVTETCVASDVMSNTDFCWQSDWPPRQHFDKPRM